MPRLLVTGASGFLGGYVCAQRLPQWQVWGVAHRHVLPVRSQLGEGYALVADLTNFSAFAKTLDELCPEIVLHLAAHSNINQCEQQPQRTYQLNVEVPKQLAQWCAQRSAIFIFVSSGQVFDGRTPPQFPHTPPNPINIYGRQKAMAEQQVRATCPHAVVVRVPVMFGWGGSFFSRWVAQLRAGQQVSAFVDEVRSFLSGRAAAQGLWALMQQLARHPDGLCGQIFHIGGVDAHSRYEFAMHLCSVFSLPQVLVRPCKQVEIPMAAARPARIVFNSSLALQAFGFDPWPLREELGWLRTREVLRG